ncbi:hypothetical protein JTB14_034404 [Gonioctena quinquepunctata]|nr:hypothetical protein JTB14_034404 [Gonioctena quinquepunctata]
MPVVIESHPNNDIEDILILETNEEGLEKEYENNTFQLLSLPSTSNDEASTRNKGKIELKEYSFGHKRQKGKAQGKVKGFHTSSPQVAGNKFMKTKKL